MTNVNAHIFNLSNVKYPEACKTTNEVKFHIFILAYKLSALCQLSFFSIRLSLWNDKKHLNLQIDLHQWFLFIVICITISLRIISIDINNVLFQYIFSEIFRHFCFINFSQVGQIQALKMATSLKLISTDIWP